MRARSAPPAGRDFSFPDNPWVHYGPFAIMPPTRYPSCYSIDYDDEWNCPNHPATRYWPPLPSFPSVFRSVPRRAPVYLPPALDPIFGWTSGPPVRRPPGLPPRSPTRHCEHEGLLYIYIYIYIHICIHTILEFSVGFRSVGLFGLSDLSQSLAVCVCVVSIMHVSTYADVYTDIRKKPFKGCPMNHLAVCLTSPCVSVCMSVCLSVCLSVEVVAEARRSPRQAV